MSLCKDRYNFYKSKNICPKCGHNEPVPGRVKCWDCLYKENESSIKYQQSKMTDEQRKRRNEYVKRKKALCVALGVCGACMKKDATQGKMCLECYVRAKNKRILKKGKDLFIQDSNIIQNNIGV